MEKKHVLFLLVSLLLISSIIFCIKKKKKIASQINYSNGVYRNFEGEDISYTKTALRIFCGTLLTRKKVGYSSFGSDIYIKKWCKPCKPLAKSQEPCITWIGHATILIQIGGVNILTDPIYAKNLSIFYPRVQSPGVAFEDLPPIHYVLISHNHADHLDWPTIANLVKRQKDSPPIMLVPQGVKKSIIKKCKYKNNKEKVREFLWYKKFEDIKSSVVFTFLPAYHSSGRNPLSLLSHQKAIFADPNRTAWGSWLIECNEFKIYFAGDTGYQKHFKDIARYIKKNSLENGNKNNTIDIALLPISPEEPRKSMKKARHMGSKEALQAYYDLEANIFIPIHWGTFQLGKDTFLGPIKNLKKFAEKDKLEIVNKFESVATSRKHLKFFAIGETQKYKYKTNKQNRFRLSHIFQFFHKYFELGFIRLLFFLFLFLFF